MSKRKQFVEHSYCAGFSRSSFTDAGVELAERTFFLAAALNIIFGKFENSFEVCGHSKVDNLEELVLLGVVKNRNMYEEAKSIFHGCN
ncbi:Uncharacterized protein APZ42_013454 [Daphnia magna]|uniref:Uncharacterized protein n=1 Tax=Daphnia magna TaxID=35525 RepID=A0A162QV79_9CRUS|nr:Uncharacterized protein APZ42_013454 [Daphnia magna]